MAEDLIPPHQMLSLGVIGGTSWFSTMEYYRHINASINALYGNQTNPPLVIYNLNQAHFHALQRAGAWDQISDIFHDAALRLKAAGCKGLLFACNTAHRVFENVAGRVDLPILHIADAIGIAARQSNFYSVGLIGTRFVMEHDFLSRRLFEDFAIRTVIPSSTASREQLHDIIQRELTMGIFKADAKHFITGEIAKLHALGASAIVLACTELPLIVSQHDVDVPVLDTSLLHARLAVDFILGRNPPHRTP